MLTHDDFPRLRRLLLTSSVTCSLVVGSAILSPAGADTPKGWESVPEVSPLGYLLVLVIIPVGLALVITLLTVLPSMARDRGHEENRSWRGDTEWFGGPTRGARAADQVTPEQVESRSKGTGGTSAGW